MKKGIGALIAVNLLVLMALSAFAQDEIKVVQVYIAYDANLQHFSISEMTTMYGYLTPEDVPGNSELTVFSGTGEELYSVRLGFIQPMIDFGPPIVDPDTNEVIEQPDPMQDEGFKGLFIPFQEDIERVELLLDGEETPTQFNVGERLCNNDGECSGEENALSCADCDPEESDGMCVWYKDGACDPDCHRGVDPDCLESLPETPEDTPKDIITPPPVGTTPGETPPISEEAGFNYALVGGVAAVFIIIIIIYYMKAVRGE